MKTIGYQIQGGFLSKIDLYRLSRYGHFMLPGYSIILNGDDPVQQAEPMTP
jgi:hypothetical protein